MPIYYRLNDADHFQTRRSMLGRRCIRFPYIPSGSALRLADPLCFPTALFVGVRVGEGDKRKGRGVGRGGRKSEERRRRLGELNRVPTPTFPPRHSYRHCGSRLASLKPDGLTGAVAISHRDVRWRILTLSNSPKATDTLKKGSEFSRNKNAKSLERFRVPVTRTLTERRVLKPVPNLNPLALRARQGRCDSPMGGPSRRRIFW